MKNILHIEDDTDIHNYVETMLNDVANITSVVSIKDADVILQSDVFDLFILDLVLKDGSGYKMARKLKEIYPDTPIAILSAHNITSAIEEADASFFKNLINEDDFVNTIKKLLN